MSEILLQLARVLDDRKSADPSTSYVASLYSKGAEAILKKVGEESTELVMAGKSGAKNDIVHETADLWFHTLVLLAYHGIEITAVLDELQARFGHSGLAEKANRISKLKE